MSANSKIEWTDHTFNPWIGCTKVSPGCANCYAEARDKRLTKGGVAKHWGKGAPRQRTRAANWKQPIKWNRATYWCGECDEWRSPKTVNGNGVCLTCMVETVPRRPRVFCASLADWLDDEVPIEWLADLLKLIHDTPNLDWLLLTKRPENWKPRLEAVRSFHVSRNEREYLLASNWLLGHAFKNIWLGTTAEDQQRADERIPELLNIPARIHFLSVEPMLGPVTLKSEILNLKSSAWVIFGGESGKSARPCNIDWIRGGVNQCQAAGVNAFVKQLGANPVWSAADAWAGQQQLKHPKGGDMAEWPEDLRIREFPV